MDGEGKPEGDGDIRDEEAGIKKGADGGAEGEGGVEGAAVWRVGGGDAGEEAETEGVGGEQKAEGEQGERKAGGPIVRAEEVHAAGSEPEHEGRLVEEADAVDVGGDEVVADEHLAGDLDVDRIDVVEQAGGEEAADVEDEPGEDGEGDGGGSPARGW